MSSLTLRRPPLVEVLIAAQFGSPLKDSVEVVFDYWNQSLRREFPNAQAADPIQGPEEQFGGPNWTSPAPQFRIGRFGEMRFQFETASGDKLVQFQSDRLILNWRRGDWHYERFDSLSELFHGLVAGVEAKVLERGGDRIDPNFWEVTYINHFERGKDWDSTEDWFSILSDTPSWCKSEASRSLESLNSASMFTIDRGAGRLRATIRHALVSRLSDGFVGELAANSGQVEVVELRLSATGNLKLRDDQSLGQALKLGHDQVIAQFAAMTSDEVRRNKWGQVDE